MKHEFVRNAIVKYAADLTNAKDNRDYVKYIAVADGKAYAADSKALISFDTDLGDGAYEVIKNTKTLVHLLRAGDVGELPDYESVLSPKGEPVELRSKLSDYIDGENMFFWDFVKAADNSNPIQFKYLRGLPVIFGVVGVDILKGENNGPYVFKAETVRVAIMPMYAS